MVCWRPSNKIPALQVRVKTNKARVVQRRQQRLYLLDGQR